MEESPSSDVPAVILVACGVGSACMLAVLETPMTCDLLLDVALSFFLLAGASVLGVVDAELIFIFVFACLCSRITLASQI
jgi:hypothetical protein